MKNKNKKNIKKRRSSPVLENWTAYSKPRKVRWKDGWMDEGRMDGWMEGRMDGRMEVKAGLRIAYSNKKIEVLKLLMFQSLEVINFGFRT